MPICGFKLDRYMLGKQENWHFNLRLRVWCVAYPNLSKKNWQDIFGNLVH